MPREKELGRETVLRWADALWQDLRFAWRALSKAPAFPAGIILTFAVAVGENTTVFSVVDAVLLRPLPHRAPEELVSVRDVYSLPGFVALRQESSVFSGLAAYTSERANAAEFSTPEQVPASRISANLFPLLGLQPLLGRFFLEDEPSGRRGRGDPRVRPLAEAVSRRPDHCRTHG